MAKARKKAKKANAVLDRFIRPTPEREAHNDTRSAGAAVCMVPPIDTLRTAGKLSEAQWVALDYYREQANKAQDDAAQSSTLDAERIMGGGGMFTGSTIPASLLATPAQLVTARIERDVAGYGRDVLAIVQAVARDDWTLTRWCIHKHGGRERYDDRGEFVAMVPRCEKRVMAEALLLLRYAAGAIVR